MRKNEKRAIIKNQMNEQNFGASTQYFTTEFNENRPTTSYLEDEEGLKNEMSKNTALGINKKANSNSRT